MNCWVCNADLTWGGDHDFEDYALEGDGIVTNLSCPDCNAFVLVYNNNGKKVDDKLDKSPQA